ncbi:hypothetical protein [Rosettibacter firmus]|uniref:hypothetical protein n=1 Tax=Rosettibacter firmus TaxID=3111522 RepID=UPI00336BD65B
MSGIKDEDFRKDNYAPVLIFNIGRWINPILGIQIGYRGFYFYYIMDDFKHYYNFLSIDGLINVNQFLSFNRKNWNLIIKMGGGPFYNHTFKKSNIYLNAGLINFFNISKELHLLLDLSAVIGDKIYQENIDILPSISFGFKYSFTF